MCVLESGERRSIIPQKRSGAGQGSAAVQIGGGAIVQVAFGNTHAWVHDKVLRYSIEVVRDDPEEGSGAGAGEEEEEVDEDEGEANASVATPAAAPDAPDASAATASPKKRDTRPARDVTYFGSMLFSRGVSGTRVVSQRGTKSIGPHSFVGYGSHCDRYPVPYITAACSVGLTKADVARHDSAEYYFSRKERSAFHTYGLDFHSPRIALPFLDRTSSRSAWTMRSRNFGKNTS